ncbi:MAG TPA: FecR family protein [Terriglobia bacterium]|nr:FecR family protein [Terriglobia bacterium]
MKARKSNWVTLVVVCLAMFPAAPSSRAQDAATPPNNYSHVRIVRLSFVEGTVTGKKPDLADWSLAPINTPVEEGFKLSTSEQSFAEVEFENTSTARLGQLTLLDFDQLVMSPSGGKVNRMTLEQGYATFTVHPEGMEVFEVKAQGATITLAAGATTQFRVDLDGGAVRVEVFKGAAQVSSPQGQHTLTNNNVVEIRPGAEQAFNVSQGIVKDAWDQWVNDRDNQEAVVRNSPTPSIYSADNSNSYYGWNDLSNYGGWSYFPGYGYGWAPYMANGWSPYMDGRWCWYPGFGYTWISSEPWGWLPYHFGGWAFQPGFGWTWFPGNFASWSPGNVNWSQGSGWVGWTPRPPRGRSGLGVCGQGQNCGQVIVRSETLRGGWPVTRASIVNPDLTGSKAVVSPDILPGRGGMLPGTVFSPATGFTGRPNTGLAQQNAGGAVTSGSNSVVAGEASGGRRSGPSPVLIVSGSRGVAKGGSGVAFDPATGRFVNSNLERPETTNSGPGSGAPSLERSADGTVSTPRQESSMTARGPSAPAGGTPHSQAPAMRPAPAPSSRSWGDSHSNSSQGWGSRSNSGGFGGGGSGSSWSGSSASHISGGGNFSGSSHSSAGASSGGGSHSGGGSSSGGSHK